MKLRQKSTY